jgi:hypothetical protein
MNRGDRIRLTVEPPRESDSYRDGARVGSEGTVRANLGPATQFGAGEELGDALWVELDETPGIQHAVASAEAELIEDAAVVA